MAASQDPRDSYSAYAMLARCRDARQLEREWRDTRQNERTDSMLGLREAMGRDYTKKACADLTEADLSPASRLALIERAAQAGLPQAAIWLSAEGPFGDVDALATRPDDPAVQEWQARVAGLIALAAAHGDVTSTMSLADQYATGGGVLKQQDTRKALKFATAYRKLHELQTGRQLTLRQVQELEGMLSADEVQRAHAQGEAFAQSAFLKWQKARNQDQR